jgi:hypothetical protein
MSKKVVPGSITEPYKKGQGDFSPNLVGQQFTNGVTLFTLGNFAITTNASASLSKVYNTGSFSDAYTLNDLNLTIDESQVLSNESLKISLNIDPNRLEGYVYFGSFFQFIKSNIEQILLKWKGSLYVDNLIDDDPERIPRNTVLNYNYDSISGTSTFKIPVSLIKNKFGLVFAQNPLFNINNYGDISDLNNSFLDYQVTNIFGDFYVLGFTGSTSLDNYVYLQVNGNPWPNLNGVGFGSFVYHVRPKEELINKYFFSRLNEFESNMLNRLITPQYTIAVNLPIRTESGTLFSSNRRLTWPTSDGYNLDNGSTEFTNYLNDWIDIGIQMDANKTDLIARRFVSDSIIEFDTEGDNTDVYGRKVNKLLRIYGREFDEVKKYIDGISISRIVTYDKKDNTADELVKVLASELGLDVLLSFFDNNLFNNTLPGNSGEEGYGNPYNVPFSGYSRNLSPKEMDFELWRRLVINAWWLFKSKGHRKVLEFFLNLFGIQKCVVSLDEYLYIAKDKLNADKVYTLLAEYFDQPVDDFISSLTAGEISYPIDQYGFPKVPADGDAFYYQMNGFWYNGGNLSEIGNNPHIGPYDYGKMYLDRFRCFVEDFQGTTTGTTTFITLDNLFKDFNNGDIEDGVSNYGGDYAQILNDNNQISSNATVVMAGGVGDVTYGHSGASLRITFSYGGSNCELTCPTDLIYYDNGIIFANDLTPVAVDLTNIYSLLNTNQQDLIVASQITEQCCSNIGGYYLPSSVSTITTICPTEGQISILPSGLVFGVENETCCTNIVVGTDVYWDGTRCILADINSNTVVDVFTADELFYDPIIQTNNTNFVCYWCPPTNVYCGTEYYDLLINSNKQLKVPSGTNGNGGGGGPINFGCTLGVGTTYNDTDGFSYIISSSSEPAPSGYQMCASFYTSQWTPILGTSPLLYEKGCCRGYRNNNNTGGGATGGAIGEVQLGPASLVYCPNISDIIINNNIVYYNYTANPNTSTVQKLGELCCTQSVVGQQVVWDGTNCVLANPVNIKCPDITNIAISPTGVVYYVNNGTTQLLSAECCTKDVVGNDVTISINGECVVSNSPSNCTFTILQTGLVSGISTPDCCTESVVGQPVIWNGNSCNLIPNDFCVIMSVSDENISNLECCKAKGGYIGLDAFGNQVCLDLADTSISVSTTNCPTTFTFLDNLVLIGTDTFIQTEVLGSDGSPLDANCCKNYTTITGDLNYHYDVNTKKCVKTEIAEFTSCRHTLIETYMSLLYPQYHVGSNYGIYGLNERVYVKLKKLIINGYDYLSGYSNLPSTVLDANYLPPDKWNSVLFIQKTLNDLSIDFSKAQLPGQPLNLSNTPNTQGTLTNIFNNGYGFYFIGLNNYSYKIELEVYTISNPSDVKTIYYSSSSSGIVVSDVDIQDVTLKTECGYQVKRTINTSNESCYTVGMNITAGIDVEPSQCYPYILGGNTYL